MTLLTIGDPIVTQATNLRVSADRGRVRVQFDVAVPEDVDSGALLDVALRGEAKVIITPVVAQGDQVPMDAYLNGSENGVNGDVRNGHAPMDGQVFFEASALADPPVYHIVRDGEAACGAGAETMGERRLSIDREEALAADLTLSMCEDCEANQ